MQPPFLCFDGSSPEYRELARDYWRGGVIEGRWKWNASTQELAEVYGVPANRLSKLATQGATAFNLGRRCIDCGEPEKVYSRSSFTTPRYGDLLCGSCVLKQYEERANACLSHIAEVATRNESFIFDNIGYTDAVIAYGLMIASDEVCETGRIADLAGLHLCETLSLSSKLVGRLFNAGMLRVDPSTRPNAVEINPDGTWSYHPLRVIWSFAADDSGRSFREVMRFLAELIDGREKHPQYAESVVELWQLLAYDDATSHLAKEVSAYRLPEVRVGAKADEAIWHALQRYSIPQVRRHLTNVVKNAAALSQHRDYERRHALNTIPGALIRYVDRALSNSWNVFPILRHWDNEEPVLLTLLFDRVLGSGLSGFTSISHGTLAAQFLAAVGAGSAAG